MKNFHLLLIPFLKIRSCFIKNQLFSWIYKLAQNPAFCQKSDKKFWADLSFALFSSVPKSLLLPFFLPYQLPLLSRKHMCSSSSFPSHNDVMSCGCKHLEPPVPAQEVLCGPTAAGHSPRTAWPQQMVGQSTAESTLQLSSLLDNLPLISSVLLQRVLSP